MAYICFCKDLPGSAETRRASTAAHLAYIEKILDRILVAGPMVEGESGNYNGSCFIYDTDQESEALKLLHNDPYYQAGIYAEISVQRFRPAAGTWVGGITW